MKSFKVKLNEMTFHFQLLHEIYAINIKAFEKENFMANIPISDISTVSETLENEDLILVSKKNDEKYISTKMTGEKLKKSLVESLFDVIYPVGSIYLSINSTLPDNFSGTWERIAEGKCLWGSDSSGSNSGTVVEAGLPNITGNFNHATRKYSSSYLDGSFTEGKLIDTTYFHYKDNYADWYTFISSRITSFDASNSNSIYGNSETVQPPALVVSMWKRTA